LTIHQNENGFVWMGTNGYGINGFGISLIFPSLVTMMTTFLVQ